jgi:hypothetical protein
MDADHEQPRVKYLNTGASLNTHRVFLEGVAAISTSKPSGAEATKDPPDDLSAR